MSGHNLYKYMDTINSCTKQDMEEIMLRVEEAIENKIASVTWKIAIALLIPILGFAVAWGGLFVQTQSNTKAIESTVLTVKDKENLENQIGAISSGISELKNDVRDIKNSLK